MSATEPPWMAGPGPVACLIDPRRIPQLHSELRPLMSRHDDTAWVTVQPLSTRDGLAPFGSDLLDACAVTGLRERPKGERHLARAAAHLRHGPVRHVLLADAQELPVPALQEAHETALLCQVRLWLIIDAAHAERHAPWTAVACQTMPDHELLHHWRTRPVPPGLCPADHADQAAPLAWPPRGCPAHTSRAHCLASAGRRLLTLGTTSPGVLRQRLNDLLALADTDVEDWWYATCMQRDLYNPAHDALTRLAIPKPRRVTIADIPHDGTTVHAPRGPSTVPAHQQAALARQRTSRTHAGCLPHEPLLGIFDITPG